MPSKHDSVKARLADALEFYNSHPDTYTISWIATKYNVPYESLRGHIVQPIQAAHGGHNRIVTLSQETAICQFIHDQLDRGIPADRATILRAVSDLRPDKSPPSKRWLQRFLKAHPEFHAIRTKTLNTQRKQAQNKANFEAFFMEYQALLAQYRIKPHNLWNFDETGYMIGCYKSTEVIVPVEVKQICRIL